MYNNDNMNDNVRYMNFKYYIMNKTNGLTWNINRSA